jgi:hypothetical protein
VPIFYYRVSTFQNGFIREEQGRDGRLISSLFAMLQQCAGNRSLSSFCSPSVTSQPVYFPRWIGESGIAISRTIQFLFLANPHRSSSKKKSHRCHSSAPPGGAAPHLPPWLPCLYRRIKVAHPQDELLRALALLCLDSCSSPRPRRFVRSMPAWHVATQPSSPTPRAPSPSTHTVPRVTQGVPASSRSFELGNTHRLRWHGSAITIVSQVHFVGCRCTIIGSEEDRRSLAGSRCFVRWCIICAILFWIVFFICSLLFSTGLSVCCFLLPKEDFSW